MEEAIFDGAEFTDVAQFKRTTFNGPAGFSDASFNIVYFDFANFTGTANFSNTDFNGEASFAETRFYDTANFSLAKFKERSYFLRAYFNKTVDFTGTYILLMNVEWSQLEGKLVYDSYFYQSLIRNFEVLGQPKDANAAYYRYKVEKRNRIDTKSP